MDENIFLNTRNVIVSNSRFVVKNDTYVMSNVTSVKLGVKAPERGWAIFSFILGLLLLFGNGAVFYFGLGLAVLGAIGINRNAEYSVILNTSAGEKPTLVDKDVSFIKDVISALNKAIVSRG